MRNTLKHIKFKLPICFALVAIFLMMVIIMVILHRSKQMQPIAIQNPITHIRQNREYTPDNVPLVRQQQAHLVSKIETAQPVVFLTMDDGQLQDERAVEFLKSRDWPVLLFLTDDYIKNDYGYFRRLINNGATIQNHTISHEYLNDFGYEQQTKQICDASNKFEKVFKSKPTLLRPPGGHYDGNTVIAAQACGIDAVVMWSAKVDAGMVQYQIGDRLVPGDIVLMHFRPKIMEDLAAFEAEIIKQGLYVARLEDWLRQE